MNHNLEIQKILLAVDTAISTKDKIKLQKQAIHIADMNNDLDWGYELRLDLMYLEKSTSHCKESIPAFAWIIDTVDANPDLFSDKEILSQYRWMILVVQRNSNFSLDQIELIRDDFRERMVANGNGLYTYYNVMFQWFMQTGNFEEARNYQKLRDSEQPGDVSYCVSCDTNLYTEIELLTGNFDKAITIADDLLSRRKSCFYEPFSALSKLMYHLAIGKDDRAESFYQKAEEEFSKLDTSESYLLFGVSRLIFYTSLHHKERAWDLFEKFSEWETDAEDYPSFYFSINLLPLLQEKGTKSLNLSSELPFFKEDNNYNIEELYNYYREKAKNLANRFDIRNKNTYFSEMLEKIESFNKRN